MICPKCKSTHIKKNGTIKENSVSHIKRHASPKQQYFCKNCKNYFGVVYELLENTPYVNNQDVEPGSVLTVKSKKTLRVHGLTDVHVGAVEFDHEKFQKAVNMIAEDDDARWFGNGDLLELIPPNYKISQDGQDIPPDEQYLEFIRLIEPIKDKCLFIRGGNHDYIRSFNILNFDVCKVLAKEMDVPYFRMPGYTKININEKIYKLVSGHGKSGGANGDTELNKMAAGVFRRGDKLLGELNRKNQLDDVPDQLALDEAIIYLKELDKMISEDFILYNMTSTTYYNVKRMQKIIRMLEIPEKINE